MPDFVLECAGIALVLYGVLQVFRDIFHPTESGSLSDWVGRLYSKLLRNTRLRPSVGPLALVTVIVTWVALLTGGFALIYCGVLPGGFRQTEPRGEPASLGRRLVRSIYISIGAFDTFETFDLVPKTDAMRIAVSLEGLLGISMITASVSWTVLLYPALARGRWFARHASLLLRAEERTGLSPVRELGVTVVAEMAAQVIEYRIDLVLFPILLNFYATDEASTVAHVLPQILRLSRDAAADPRPEMKMAAAGLQLALEDLAETIASRILNSEDHDPDPTFQAFRRREED